MIIILRIFAWFVAAAVTFATLGPPRFRPHADLGQDGEHALAFILIGLAFGAAYPPHPLPATGMSFAGIGLLESLHLWAPGRHARLEDFVVDASMACVGLAITAGLNWAIRRSRRPNPA